MTDRQIFLLFVSTYLALYRHPDRLRQDILIQHDNARAVADRLWPTQPEIARRYTVAVETPDIDPEAYALEYVLWTCNLNERPKWLPQG